MKIKNFEVSNNQKLSFSWAIKFLELFLKNLKNKGAPLKKIKEVGYEDFVEPIPEMIENDGITETHLQLAYELIQKDEFWNGIVLDTEKLREKIGQLIAQGKMPVKIKEMDIRVQDKIIIRTPQPLSTFPLNPGTSQKRRSLLRGKRFVEKVLDTGKKVIPFVALIRRKSGTAPLQEQLFYLSPPDLYFFQVLYLPQPVESLP